MAKGYRKRKESLTRAVNFFYLKHPAGRPWGPEGSSCGACMWSGLRGPGPLVLRCIACENTRVGGGERGCDLFEPKADCLACGACCGPAFDAVELSRRDPVIRAQPHLIATDPFGRPGVRRTASNHCAALDLSDNRCAIYADRPRCCRDLAPGGPGCLFARRRAGLSPS